MMSGTCIDENMRQSDVWDSSQNHGSQNHRSQEHRCQQEQDGGQEQDRRQDGSAIPNR